jgi:hypothetical protein
MVQKAKTIKINIELMKKIVENILDPGRPETGNINTIAVEIELNEFLNGIITGVPDPDWLSHDCLSERRTAVQDLLRRLRGAVFFLLHCLNDRIV